ncbi:MAG: hypothetical protein R3C68_16970 [Myxococcota bacterium]
MSDREVVWSSSVPKPGDGEWRWRSLVTGAAAGNHHCDKRWQTRNTGHDRDGRDWRRVFSSFANVNLPLCDGTYSQADSSRTFASQTVIQAQHFGKVRFTGEFSPGSNLTFKGIVVIGTGEKFLGSNNIYENMRIQGAFMRQCGKYARWG